MKMKYLSMSMLPVAACGLALMSGCVVQPGGVYVRPPVVAVVPPPPPPPPVVIAPAPVVVAPAPVVVGVPDSYVWDGVEYVGVVGDTWFYLGPGNVWLVSDPVRIARFHDWERFHPDWRVRLAIRNDRFRTDRYGHVAPRHEVERRDVHEERHDDHR
jgi:hypothetical protein